jgi:LPXTG-motif cell wall-anchored protein
VQEKEFIGGLDKDEFSTVQFKIKSRDVQPGAYPITVTITYKDKSGEWKEKEIQDSLVLYRAKGNDNGILLYALAGIVIAALLVWHFRFRKR